MSKFCFVVNLEKGWQNILEEWTWRTTCDLYTQKSGLYMMCFETWWNVFRIDKLFLQIQYAISRLRAFLSNAVSFCKLFYTTSQKKLRSSSHLCLSSLVFIETAESFLEDVCEWTWKNLSVCVVTSLRSDATA